MRICGSLCLLLALAGLSAAQDTNFPIGPQYLITSGSPIFLHPIATPSLSFDSGLTPPQPSVATEEQASGADEQLYEAVDAILAEQRRTVLLSIYYGIPQVNVVELTSMRTAEGEAGPSIPASIFNPGVAAFTTPQALRERGYGATIAEAAARSKTHKTSARHVYTNDDIERLRPRD